MSTHARRLRASSCPAALTILLATGLAAAPAADAARCRGGALAPASAPRAAQAAVVCEINRERRARGLRPVGAHPRLTGMARRYARSMVRMGFFSHTSPGGVTLLERVRAAGYGGRRIAAGEALAWAQGRLATPHAIVRAWLHSPPHRAVLLGRAYRDVGIGVALGSPNGRARRSSATYAADFGAAR
jgi:uncharacterized protein YkwD